MANKTMVEGARALRKALDVLATETGRELNITQALVLLRIAEAGDEGVDAGRLAEATGASPAAISRTVRILGEVHYLKQHEGFGLVDLQFDPTDNRKRVVRLTADGRVLINQMAAKL